MKHLFLAALFILCTATLSAAVEVAGVPLEPTVTVNGQQLKLNGHGIRKKWFVKVYIGSLYSAKHVSSGAEALNDGGDKLIRLNFLHSKVDKEKISDALGEGLANNSPDLVGSPDVQKFLALFTADFMKGDVVDMVLSADGSVSVSHNGRALGRVPSTRLAKGVLAIYLGDKPADDSLKNGMLGN
ncbi:MAG: chalcone isomerase family protein [Desulfuromonadaceae bacterium]|nr:chalcone isomerase family protein [Desulfuromonadaceae bacterium]MDD5104476.1 chalcone isomerase family protein [Desulfuromonadaceae bacterium]